MRGGLVYVMGPSGAGKDTLLTYARQRLEGERVLFAHRYITRMPVPGDENFIALSHEEYDARLRLGAFAMSWHANGHCYAVGAEIDLWREAGATVVVSGSREHFAASLTRRSDVTPVVITARPEVIAERLSARGRESGDDIARRLQRGEALKVEHRHLLTIDNSGPVEMGGDKLIEAVRRSALVTV
jgi:ribose 1,5-bisphosphokinase